MDRTLPRSSILRSRKDIETLLSEGRSFFRHPLKIQYLKNTGSGKARMMVSVPKKNFHNAVDRNLLKRRIREAFRLNRSILGDMEADFLFIYLAKEIEDYDSISERIREGLARVAEESGE